MGKKPRAKAGAGRGRGRPRRALAGSERMSLLRTGILQGVSASRQLEALIRASGVMSPVQAALADSVVRAATKPHPGEVTLGSSTTRKSKRIVGTKAAERALERLVVGLGFKRTAWGGTEGTEEEPWVLRSAGACAPHTDTTPPAPPRLFSLLVCVRADAPYVMRFSSNQVLLGSPSTLDVPVSTGAFLCFPATVVHECVALPAEQRVVINTFVQI